MVLWNRFKKQKLQKIIAIDIGTASISGVIAQSSDETSWEIIKKVSNSYDLFKYPDNFSNRMVFAAIRKTFAGLFSATKNLNEIRISLAHPFATLHTDIYKKTLQDGIIIKKNDLNIFVKDMVQPHGADNSSSNVRSFNALVREWRVNGYVVHNPIGYRGVVLEAVTQSLEVTDFFASHFNEICNEFFADIPKRYFAEITLLEKAVSHDNKLALPAFFVDIGGEVTSRYFIKNGGDVVCLPSISSGVRAIERYIASQYKCSLEEASSLLHRFTRNALDISSNKAIELIIDKAITRWSDKIIANIARVDLKSVIVGGGGREITSILQRLHDALNVPAVPFVVLNDDIVPHRALSSGEDIMLLLLLKYGRF